MTTPSPFAAWLDLPPGHRFGPFAGHLTAARQARQHAACDVSPALFAERIDPSLLGQDMVLMASREGLAVDGRVHVAHRIRQHAPLPLGAGYALAGRVASLRPVARGHEVEVAATATTSPPSDPAVELAALYLLPGLAPAAGVTGATPPAPVDPAALAPIGRLQLTPERVMSYSADVGNLLHFDPAYAAARGFRAPIAQGLMLVTAFLGALGRARGDLPESFAIEARFRRPAFWDDGLEFLVHGAEWCCIAADRRLLVDGSFTAGSIRN